MRKFGLLVPVAALLSGVFAAAAVAQGLAPDIFAQPGAPGLSAAATNTLGPGFSEPPFKSADARVAESPAAGNPLWAIPLGDLAQTQARPLFSSSRRPAASPIAAAPPPVSAKPTPPARAEPDHPRLTLLGTIVSPSIEIGVFIDEASQDVVRLKAGEAHDGWTLSTVSGRAVIFQKPGHQAATLLLPAPGAEANARVPPANIFAPPVIPASTRGGAKRPARES